MGQDSPGYLLNEADKIHVEPVENLRSWTLWPKLMHEIIVEIYK